VRLICGYDWLLQKWQPTSKLSKFTGSIKDDITVKGPFMHVDGYTKLNWYRGNLGFEQFLIDEFGGFTLVVSSGKKN
jgi:hypothetical protein